MCSSDLEFAGQRWRWTMNVTQTEVESLRRMDVAVHYADRPEGEALITVTGFYGTAIGAVGGSVLPWANGQPASGNDGEDGGNDGGDEADRQPDTGDESPTRRPRDEPPEEEDE